MMLDATRADLLCGLPDLHRYERRVCVCYHNIAATHFTQVGAVTQDLANGLVAEWIGLAILVVGAAAREVASLQLINDIHNGIAVRREQIVDERYDRSIGIWDQLAVLSI